MNTQRSFMLKFVPAVLLSFSPASKSYAQHIVIDGSKTPQLIPDVIATRLVLMSIAQPPNPAPTESAKRELRLQRLWLTPADANAVRRIADSFLSDYTEWPSSYSSQDAAASKATRITLINAFVAYSTNPNGYFCVSFTAALSNKDLTGQKCYDRGYPF